MTDWCGLAERKDAEREAQKETLKAQKEAVKAKNKVITDVRRSNHQVESSFDTAFDSFFNTQCITCCGESKDSKSLKGTVQAVPGLQSDEGPPPVLRKQDILFQIEEEVNRLFDRFDADGSGQIDGARELKLMVADLRTRGFTFGKKLAEMEAGPGDSIASSRYGPILSRTIQGDILRTYDDDGSGSLGKPEFHDWFFKEVISRKTNLRLLLHQNPWLMQVIDRIFLECDSDGGGTVAPCELEKPLCDIAHELGEPPPNPDEINAILRKADASGDGELSPLEFRFVMVEVATRLFFGHFNHSMHPHQHI